MVEIKTIESIVDFIYKNDSGDVFDGSLKLDDVKKFIVVSVINNYKTLFNQSQTDKEVTEQLLGIISYLAIQNFALQHKIDSLCVNTLKVEE